MPDQSPSLSRDSHCGRDCDCRLVASFRCEAETL